MAEQDDATTLGNMELAIQAAMMAARTVTVGRVLAYREIGPNKAPVVDVQFAPQLAARPVDGAAAQTKDIAPKRNIPVAFWQAGDFTIRTPISKGQHVLILVCDRDLNTWMQGDGSTYRPGIPGVVHNLNDAIAMPFLTPEAFQPGVRPSARELFIGDRTGQVASITLDSGASKITIKAATTIDIESNATVNVNSPAVTLGSAGTTAPIARVGIDFVVVPPGGGTVPIVPGPIPGGLPSAHKVKG